MHYLKYIKMDVKLVMFMSRVVNWKIIRANLCRKCYTNLKFQLAVIETGHNFRQIYFNRWNRIKHIYQYRTTLYSCYRRYDKANYGDLLYEVFFWAYIIFVFFPYLYLYSYFVYPPPPQSCTSWTDQPGYKIWLKMDQDWRKAGKNNRI